MKFTMGKKIGLGFFIVLGLTTIVGATGYLAMKRVVFMADMNRQFIVVRSGFADIKEQANIYFINNFAEAEKTQQAAQKRLETNVQATRETIRSVESAMGHSPEIAKALDAALGHVDGYRSKFDAFRQAEAKKRVLAADIALKFNNIAEAIEKAQMYTEEVAEQVNVSVSYSNLYMDRSTESRWEKVTIELTALQAAIDRWYEYVAANPTMKPIGDQLKALFAELQSNMEAFHQEVEIQGDHLAKMGVHEAELVGTFKAIREMALAEMQRVAQRSGLTVFITLLTSILVGTLYGWLSTKSIVRRVRHVSDGLKELAMGAGDLTTRLPVESKDEIGDLSKWFNQFMEKQQEMIKEIADAAKGMEASSGNLFGISRTVSELSVNMSGNSNHVAAAAEQMSGTMTTIATASQGTADRVGVVASAAEEMSATVNEIAKNAETARTITNNAVTRAETASADVHQLSLSAEEIDRVTEVISEISEQTNLLALNATIEAARAGEAGKGFSVVANEIKDLARQTAGATQEINEKIVSIQSSTTKTTKELEEILNIIQKVDEIVTTIATAVEEQSASTLDIANTISHISQGISGVSESVNASSKSSESIAADIARVDQDARKLKNENSRSKADAETLSRLASQLKEMVSRFVV
ncbi:MAG: methyl-accepting chemotaxis protein [Desulfobacteraceae bacterium]|jgi:methyl-accepting chemotaxis protein